VRGKWGNQHKFESARNFMYDLHANLISRGIGVQFRIMQRSALSNLYKNSCCRCKQTISPAEQWYSTCQFKAFVDMQYFLKQFCCLSLIKLHMVQGVNNVQKCLITAFLSLTTKLGRCHPNVCTAETGSQLLTATSYRDSIQTPIKSVDHL
jgi:hypothetical protein